MIKVVGGKYKMPVTVKKIKKDKMTVIEVNGDTYVLVPPGLNRNKKKI